MLVVRAEQMHALSKATRESFVSRMVSHVLRQLGSVVHDMSVDRVADQTRSAIAMAERHEIVAKDDIRRFVECFFLQGASIEVIAATPWIANVLNTPGLDGRAKMDRIDDLELQRLRIIAWRG